MRIPLNWLGEYIRLPKDISLLTDKLTMAGHMLDKVDNAHGDTVIDLELRGNRADCYSILGIAREVSALFKTPVKYPPTLQKIKIVKNLPELTLSVKTPLVKRVVMMAISDIKISPSPSWLAHRLKAYGIEPVNNIVDLTNYVMLETGEPMHAFDLDKIGRNIHIRLAKKGEKILTFLGKKLLLTDSDLVWANHKSVISVGGAIGEKTNSISPSTKNILVEAASYDRANIRRTIHKHNLFTDAGIRHEKELDPNLAKDAIKRFAYLMAKNNWGTINSQVSNYYPKPVKPWKLNLDYSFLERLSGLRIEARKVKEILSWLNLKTLKSSTKGLVLSIPTYRTDVTLEEDLVEEVLRIIGYDQIPVRALSLEIPKDITPDYIKQELDLKGTMTSLGFDEIISLSFVAQKSQTFNANLTEEGSEVKVENSPSPDTQIMRLSLMPNLLEATEKVINERGDLVQFFEIGKTYHRTKSGYTEKRKLGMIYWNKEENNYPIFKGFLEGLFSLYNLTIPDLISTQLPNLKNAYSINLGKTQVGIGGRIDTIYYAEIDLDSILGKQRPQITKLWPKYPPQIEDLTLILPPTTHIGNLIKEAFKVDNIEEIILKDIYETAYTFRVWYQNPTKTLTNTEVEKIREKLLTNLATKFGASLKV